MIADSAGDVCCWGRGSFIFCSVQAVLPIIKISDAEIRNMFIGCVCCA